MTENLGRENTGKKSGRDKNRGRRFCRLLSWVFMVILILIIVPVGAVMFVVSGVWSAADRALLKFNK